MPDDGHSPTHPHGVRTARERYPVLTSRLLVFAVVAIVIAFRKQS